MRYDARGGSVSARRPEPLADYETALGRTGVRNTAHRFGGSHAQRELITLTLIEAAIRAADRSCALHYLAERRMLKSEYSHWGPRLKARAG